MISQKLGIVLASLTLPRESEDGQSLVEYAMIILFHRDRLHGGVDGDGGSNSSALGCHSRRTHSGLRRLVVRRQAIVFWNEIRTFRISFLFLFALGSGRVVRMAMILAEHLTRDYGSGQGVFDLSFSVDVGELFVFLGPNGAGKSSTVRMLTGLSTPDSGTASVAGFGSVRHRLQLKHSIGYVAERPHLDERLTGREFVNFVADVFGVSPVLRDSRVAELFQAFELQPVSNQLIETYSHGQRQKIALAAALIHQPAALFLDEPTNGLDPRSARIVKDVLRQICSRGATVFMTTHVLEIAEAMADRIAVLSAGRMAAIGSMTELQLLTGLPGASLEDIYLKLTGSAESPVLSLYSPA